MNTVKLMLFMTFLSSTLAAATVTHSTVAPSSEANGQELLIASFARGLNVTPHRISMPTDGAESTAAKPLSRREVFVNLVDSFNAGLGISLEQEEKSFIARNSAPSSRFVTPSETSGR